MYSEKEIVFLDQRTLESSATTCNSLCQDSLYFKNKLICLLFGEIIIFQFDLDTFALSDI